MPLIPGAGMGGPPPGHPMGGAPPGMGGGMPPGMGGPPGMPPGMPGMGGMGGGFPSTDPSQVAPQLGGIRQMQIADQQSLQDQQSSVLQMLVEAMRNDPNPLAQMAQTAPAYPMPSEDPNA